MRPLGVLLSGLVVVSAAPVFAQDRSGCTGIYCPQARAADNAAELTPYASPGKTWEQVKGRNTLVVKYYNRDGTLASTRQFSQTAYMQPIANASDKVAFAGQGTPMIALYGLSPCKRAGSFDFKGERFSCESFWRSRMADNLYGTQVVLCRAYADQIDRPIQEATCLTADEGAGGRVIGGVVLDDALVGIGAAILQRGPDSKLLRPELAGAEKTGAAILAGAR